MLTERNSYDAIVIGSGMGGLTVASLLAQLYRQRVLVLERADAIGGLTRSFRRPGGYAWDIGLQYVGQLGPGTPTRQVMDLVTGGQVGWVPLPDPVERFVYPDLSFDLPVGADHFRGALVALFPDELAGIEAHFRDLERARRWGQLRLSLGGLSPLFRRVGDSMLRGSRELALRPTADVLRRRLKSPALRGLLASQWARYGLPPSQSAFLLHAQTVEHYLEGAWYPSGGAETIPAAARAIVEAHGGAMLPAQRVRRIVVQGGRATGVRTDDAEFRAPVVVSDAGALATYGELLRGVPLPFRGELESLRGGHATVSLYLGLGVDPRALGFDGATYWIHDDYDHDRTWERRGRVCDGDATSCQLSFPSLKDPAAIAHTAEVVAPVDAAAFGEWTGAPRGRRGPGYDELKARITGALLDLVERRFPGFRRVVAHAELATPLSLRDATGHDGPRIYGIPGHPARYRAEWLGARTPVPGLVLTGADVASHGIVGAMLGGVVALATLRGPRALYRALTAAPSAPPAHATASAARPGAVAARRRA